MFDEPCESGTFHVTGLDGGAYNGATTDLRVTLPARAADTRWVRVADTGAWMEPDANFAPDEDGHVMQGNSCDLVARALAIFVER